MSMKLNFRKPRTKYLKRSLCYDGASLWDGLPQSMRMLSSLSLFSILSSSIVQNLHTRLVKIDHVCLGYLATTSRSSVLLLITHKKRALYKLATSEA